MKKPSMVIMCVGLVLGTGMTHGCAPGAGYGVPTRAQREAAEDAFCRGVAKARVFERDFGLSPDAGIPVSTGDAGSSP